MKRKAISLVMVIALMTALLASVHAAQPRITNYTPSLIIDGTTAYCALSVISSGDDITANLSLWRGNSFVASWTASGQTAIAINETCRVMLGNMYTLKFSYTINGVSYTGPEVTAKS